MREQPRAGDTDLPGVEEDTTGRGRRDFLDVHIGHHDHRRLAAEFQSDALQRIGRIAVDDLANLGRARERDLVDVRVLHQPIARRVTAAGDDVDHARREAGLSDEVRHAQRRQRGLLGGLEHQRAAGGERRRYLQRRHQEREVPGDDLGSHPDGLARDVAEHFAARQSQGVDHLATELRGPARHVTEVIHGARDIDHRRKADRLTVVDGFELGELRGVRLDQVCELVDGALAHLGRQVRPASIIECHTGRRDGAVHIGVGGIHDAAHFAARGRVLDDERRAVAG